ALPGGRGALSRNVPFPPVCLPAFPSNPPLSASVIAPPRIVATETPAQEVVSAAIVPRSRTNAGPEWSPSWYDTETIPPGDALLVNDRVPWSLLVSTFVADPAQIVYTCRGFRSTRT